MALRYGLAGLLALTLFGCAVTPPAVPQVPDALFADAPLQDRALLQEGIHRGLFSFGTQQTKGAPVAAGVFEVSFGKSTGYFSSVANLGVELEVVEHKIIARGANEAIIRVMPGRRTWTPVRLQRGVTSDKAVWEWMQQITEGRIDNARFDVRIVQYDNTLKPVAEWNLTKAWPSKLVSGNDPENASAGAVEELTLVHEGFKRIK